MNQSIPSFDELLETLKLAAAALREVDAGFVLRDERASLARRGLLALVRS